jgi:hypothetical protein
MLWLPLVASVALAANPDLDKAAKLVGDLQYAEAQPALEAALKRTGNDRETLLQIYELQGVVYATLNNAAKATKAFQALLVLDPDHKLAGDNPPRVMTPFYEARGRATELGKLDARPLPAAVAGMHVAQLAVEISNDPLKMAKKVRFHQRADDKDVPDALADISGKTASIAADSSHVEWWAEVLGERDAVLLQLGSKASPKVEGRPEAAMKVAPIDEPVTTTPPSPPVESVRVTPTPAPSEPTPSSRYAGIALVAGGVVGLALGATFGVLSNNARGLLDGAQVDAMNRVINFTQVQAKAWQTTQNTDAVVADVLFGVGGALAATGIVLFIVSLSSSSSVALAPTGNGAALSGTW